LAVLATTSTDDSRPGGAFWHHWRDRLAHGRRGHPPAPGVSGDLDAGGGL